MRPTLEVADLVRAHGDEYVDVTSEWPAGSAPTEASDQGAGPLGFAGAAAKNTAAAAGLTTRADDSFGCGPAMPMLPASWEPGDGLRGR